MSEKTAHKPASGKRKSTRKAKAEKVSYHKQPENIDLNRWQAALRKQFAETQPFHIQNEGKHPVFSDFSVYNPQSKKAYKVAIRSARPGKNFCSCNDFKTNQLGTCKHLEAVWKEVSAKRGAKKIIKQGLPPKDYTSVFIHYGETRQIMISFGTEEEKALKKLASRYFDKEQVLLPAACYDFDQFVEKARQISPVFKVYPDALEFILQKREDERRRKVVDDLLSDDGSSYLDQLIKANLFSYQRQGVAFAAKAGRCLIADEMGLGKTVQAIGAAELLLKEQFISKILVICPTSLKYQWKSELEKFTGRKATVVEGGQLKRRKIYESTQESDYLILTYNAVYYDVNWLNDIGADLIILDEAQRIKNWNTKISQAVKRLETPYAFVLTGTPLENKLEELYSIAQFVDIYALGPLHTFLFKHQIKTESGQIVGYRDLSKVNEKLSSMMIRRQKKNVLKDLPERMDKNLFVPMTDRQTQIHQECADVVAQLVAKWQRVHFLSEKDRLALLKALNLMRMVCDSTYVIDQQTRHDTKVDELMYILEETLSDPDIKVVVFSQWERMTRLVAAELEVVGIGFESLHGAVNSKERGEMIARFTKDPDSRVFLSTDAGGTGLNLQVASVVINLDLPWNPGVLEQRIGRIYRIGQHRNIQVINMVATGTIEHRMLSVLDFKSSMIAGALDNSEEDIIMNTGRFKKFMESVQEITGAGVDIHQPEEVTADSDMEESIVGPAAEPVPSPEPEWEERQQVEEEASRATSETSVKQKETSDAQGRKASASPSVGSGDLVQMGVNFLGSLAKTLSDKQATQNLVESLVKKDEQTGQTYLKIPVESQEIVQNAVTLLAGLFKGLGR